MNDDYYLTVLTYKFGFVAKSLDAMTVFYESPDFVLSETIDGWELRINKEVGGETIMYGTLEQVVSWIEGGCVFFNE